MMHKIINAKLNKTDIWIALLGVVVILNELVVGASYYLKKEIVTFNLIIWIFLLGFSFIFNNVPNKNRIFLTVLICVCGLIGNIHGSFLVENGISSLDNMLVNFVSIIVLWGMKGKKITKNNLILVMKIVVICGLFAALYATVFQSFSLIRIIKRVNVSYYSWLYTSFLGHRNIYAGYCFLSSGCVLYLYSIYKEKRILYGGILLFFFLQIFFTNSRAALVSDSIMIFLYMLISLKKEKKLLFIYIIVILMLCLSQTKLFIDELQTVFIHTTSNGVDSGSIRLVMWKGALNYLLDHFGVIFGVGIYPMSVILLNTFGYASTHNVYLDYFFQGGLSYVLLMIVILLSSWKKIRISEDIYYKNVMTAFFISFIIYNMFECTVGTIFSQNHFSPTSTIIFVILPLSYCKSIITTTDIIDVFSEELQVSN